MNTLFTKFKSLNRPFITTLSITFVLNFAVAFMLGQYATAKDTKKHYIVDASEVEIVYHNPYKALTLNACVTDYECNIAQLLDDQANGRFVSTNDPIFFPDSIPVIEPIDYEQGESPSECAPEDKECLEQNVDAGKPAHYPSICEPYIFPNEHKESTP